MSDTEKLVIRFLFLIIPLMVFISLTPLGATGSKQVKNSFWRVINSSTTQYSESRTYSINTENELGSGLRLKLMDFFGKPFSRANAHICFSNNGTQYADVISSSFVSKIVVNNKDEIYMPYIGSICYDLDPKKDQFTFVQSTSYNYTDKNVNIIDIHPNYIVETFVSFDINNSNLLMNFITFLFSWWALLLIITKVGLIVIKGKFNP